MDFMNINSNIFFGNPGQSTRLPMLGFSRLFQLENAS
ncbi:hypothetical protein P872_07435 [Rhodonellum psychrophilum GCM71 = DSM 17998]|uniref:Uncharacterized protein n=1 Tax=Rhodonellum psychrophilum GCM71 = DSM 17998 TaxID=1123057 RepID=U5BN68_9BACT|nr:hypothetical protein P872_07435 [Rhodonellum psychrophilum GCM71 = DSM 17998]